MDGIPTVPAKNIVYKSQAPSHWFGADYNMNIYRGCSHGCIYCDSRSDCYRNADFDIVKAKEDALTKVRNDLRRKVKTGVIATGAMSDPYNPLEKRLELTRNSLELINAYSFGVSIATKSALVMRDADILSDIQAHSPVIIKMTITAADDAVCKLIEPNVSFTSERFAALRTLAQRGIFCGVLMMPILPYITDTPDNIVGILRQAKESGAKFVYGAMGMTLRQGNRGYYYDRLDESLPDLKAKYIKRYGNRYNVPSPHYKKLWGVFVAECERLGLLYDMGAIIQHYKAGYGNEQQMLF